jgi:gp16 family phage-associated protein
MDSETAKDEERRGRPVAPRPDPVRIDALRSRMTAKGQTVKALAREIDENASHVYKVLSGTRAASSGAGHRIAVKLGLKDDPATLPGRARMPLIIEPTR